jgi:Protein of unknown function (DUF3592)
MPLSARFIWGQWRLTNLMSLQHKVGLSLLAVATVFGLLSGPAIIDGWKSEDWPSVQGTIDSVRLNDDAGGDTPTWRVLLRYHYSVEGRRYEGTRFTSTGEFYSGDETRARHFEAAHQPGTIVEVFYNPSDPSDSLLSKGLDYRHWFLFGLTVFLFLVGAGVVLRILPVSVKNPQQAETGPKTMTAARKRALSRYVFIVAAIVLIKPIRDLAIGAVGQGPLADAIGVATLVITVAYVLWMFFWWRPKCPKCRIARAKFTRRGGREERLICAACDYDEPTGITPG